MSDKGWTTVSYKNNKPKQSPSQSQKSQAQPYEQQQQQQQQQKPKEPGNTSRITLGDFIVKKSSRLNTNKQQVDSIKIEEQADEGTYKISKVSNTLSLQLQQERQKKKMTQKQLALQCNLQENIIRNYENGTAVPNQQELNKLSKALGVSLKSK